MNAHPSFFGDLSPEQVRIEERIRTLCLCVCALGVIGYALYSLRPVLIPLVLALAMKYLLQPLIETMTVRPLKCCGYAYCVDSSTKAPRASSWKRPLWDLFCMLKLPHWAAVLIALAVAFTMLGVLGLVVADSVRVFTARADVYSMQIQLAFKQALEFLDNKGLDKSWAKTANIKALAEKLPLTHIFIALGETVLELLSNLFLVLLFTVYLLLDGGDVGTHGVPMRKSTVLAQVDAQIMAYLKGKVMLSVLVGALTCFILWAIGTDLWLVFGLMAFWLNFVPNVGAVVAVILPMPVVLFDPDTYRHARLARLRAADGAHASLLSRALSLPLSQSLFRLNELSPCPASRCMRSSETSSSQCSLPLDGVAAHRRAPVPHALGLALGHRRHGAAVPITAVLRIHWMHVDHPLPRWLARVLVGRSAAPRAYTPARPAWRGRDRWWELHARGRARGGGDDDGARERAARARRRGGFRYRARRLGGAPAALRDLRSRGVVRAAPAPRSARPRAACESRS